MTYYNGEDYKSVVSEGLTLVDFYADWCGPCKMLGSVLEDFEDQIKIIKVDIDKYNDLANEFKIMSIPHVKFYKDGREVSSFTGFMDKDMVQEKIEEIKKL